MFGVIWAQIASAARFAQGQSDTLPNIASMDGSVDPDCLTNPSDLSELCQLSRGQEELARAFELNVTTIGEIGQAYDTLPGLVHYVSHQGATTIGWITLAMIAAFHVAGEWQNRSLAVSVHAAGSRRRFFALKVASTWIITLFALVATIFGLFVTRSTFVKSGIVSNATQDGTVQYQANAAWTDWSTSLSHFAIAAGVLLAVSAVVVAFSMVVRRAMPTAFAGLALVGAFYLIGPVGWSPINTTAVWFDLDAVNSPAVGGTLLWNYEGTDLSVGLPTIDLDMVVWHPIVTAALIICVAIAAAVVVEKRQAA